MFCATGKTRETGEKSATGVPNTSAFRPPHQSRLSRKSRLSRVI
jgi:hypothetical protein